jgi:hypothetical protein
MGFPIFLQSQKYLDICPEDGTRAGSKVQVQSESYVISDPIMRDASTTHHVCNTIDVFNTVYG